MSIGGYEPPSLAAVVSAAADDDFAPAHATRTSPYQPVLAQAEMAGGDGDGFELDAFDEGGPARGAASVASSVFSVSNTILGAGSLAMASACRDVGIAFFLLLLLATGCVAHYAVLLLVEVVEMLPKGLDTATAARVDYAYIGEAAYGPRGRLLAQLAVIFQQLGPCIIYIQILSDVFLPVFGELGASDGSAMCNRPLWMSLFVIFIIFPLCMLRTLDKLRVTSFLALAIILSFALVVFGVGAAAIADPDRRLDYYTASVEGSHCGRSGSAESHIHPPGDDVSFFALGSGFLNALPIITFSFLCHMNIFPVYAELEDASVARMATVSRTSMTICAVVYFLAGAFGYLIFLDSTHDDLLTNFALKGTSFSGLMNVLRIAFGFALIFSYPLIIFELRHMVGVLVFGHLEYSVPRQFLLNVAIIGPCLGLAIGLDSIGVVFGAIGSTMSPLIVFVLPPLFWLKVSRDTHTPHDSPHDALRAKACLVAGLVLIPVSLTNWGITNFG